MEYEVIPAKNEDEIVKKGEESTGLIKNFSELGKRSLTQQEIYTNITDRKKLFNLESNVTHLLNDCEGEIITVKEVLIKIFKKPLKEPIIDETTGEVIKEYETTMSCVIVSKNDESYATGSKMFTIQLMRYIQNWGIESLENDDVNIKITKNKIKNNNNKSLGFELV